MRVHQIPLEPHPQMGPHHYAGAVILRVDGVRGRRVRHHVGYVSPDGKARRVFQGPIEPGPYAYAFALPVVIAAHPIPDPQPVVDAQLGDVLEMDGRRWEITWTPDRGDSVKLVPVDEPTPSV